MSYQQMNRKRQQRAQQSSRTGTPPRPAAIITFTDSAGHVIPTEPGDVLEDDDSYYETRPPTSVIRRSAENAPAQPRVRVEHHYYDQPYQQGDFIERQSRTATHAPPHQQPQYDYADRQVPHRPVTRGRQRQRIKGSWLLYLGIGLLIAIFGWIMFSILGVVWQQQMDTWTYGNPRTYQVDAVVGHADTNSNPSHFIALNLKGQIIVIELPGGSTTKAIGYAITTLPDNTANPPVKLVFQDVNHDGRLDMVVEIGDPPNTITFMFFNNGSQFVSKL